MDSFVNIHRRKFLKYSGLTIGTLLSTVSCSRETESGIDSSNAALKSTPTSKKETVRLAQNLSPISGVSIVAMSKNFFTDTGTRLCRTKTEMF